MIAKKYCLGTHRACTPGETLERFAPLMPRLGITRLADVTGLDVIGVPVFMAVRPNSRGLSVSQGKGVEPEAAKVSALMESIESWHGENVDVTLRYEAYRALASSHAVLDVASLPRRRGGALRLDAPLLFARGQDLLAGGDVWVPHDCVSTSFVDASRSATPFLKSTNGLASGNDLDEATLHGLCEVVERDAMTLWSGWRDASALGSRVDLSGLEDAACRTVLDRLAASSVGVGAWDLTTDVGIPVYFAAVFETQPRPRWRPMGMFSGYGCHLDPGVALSRALTEAVQSRLTMIAGSRDDLLPSEYRRVSGEAERAALALAVAAPGPRTSLSAQPSRATGTSSGDLGVVLDALRSVGITQACVVDLSRAELQVPVVKVVVPGLEGIGLAPGYLPGARARAAGRRAA